MSQKHTVTQKYLDADKFEQEQKPKSRNVHAVTQAYLDAAKAKQELKKPKPKSKQIFSEVVAEVAKSKSKSKSKSKPKPRPKPKPKPKSKSKKSKQATKLYQKPLPTSKKWPKTIDLGWAVRAFRQRINMSTTDLAEKTGLSQAQVSRLENNLQGLRSGTLLKIAKVLRVKPWLLFMTEEERQTVATKIGLGV